MKTKSTRHLFIWIVVIAGIGIFLFPWLKPAPAPNSQLRLKEEQAVYSVLFAGAAYRLEENTSLGRLSVNAENHSDLSALSLDCGSLSPFTNRCTVTGFQYYVPGTEPEVSREIAVDFEKNNQQPYLLRDYLPSPNTHLLLRPGDIEDLPDGGWVSVSRVGFNAAFTQALVLLNQVAKVNGIVDVCNQFYKILEKVDGKWVMREEVQILDCVLPPSQN